jgi:DNA-binding IclR family transcriptional regulator
MRTASKEEAVQLGVKSIEVGARLLHVLAQAERAMPLKELSEKARLSPSSAHRYLVSYSRAGLIRQDTNTRLYDLGPFAMQFGIAAMGRSKLLTRAEQAHRKLGAQLNESVVLAVWGTYGPVILSIRESSKPIVMTMRIGATMPLLRTATGWVFAAFIPPDVVAPVMRAEIARGRGPVKHLSTQAFQKKLAGIRASRLAFHAGDLLPGVPAVASPLLGPRGEMVAVLSVFGHSENFDPLPQGTAAMALKRIGQSFPDF